MAKKKPFKVLIITFFCVITLIGITTLAILFIRFDNSNSQPEQNLDTDRFFVAQVAIFNNKYSQNFNGTYKFQRVNFAALSNLSDDVKTKIYENYKVSDTMGLLSAMTEEKKKASKNLNETLIIENGIFQINHNFHPYKYGTVYGNDDYSVLTDSKKNKIATISLTNLSAKELKSINSSDDVVYHGSELYITQTKEFIFDDTTCYLDIVYVYDLVK